MSFIIGQLIKRFQYKQYSLETIIVLANDELVNLFLLKKLNFTGIHNTLKRLINMKEFIKLSKKKPGSFNSRISLKGLIKKKINKMINWNYEIY